MPRWKPWILSRQHHVAIATVQTLAHALSVERSNDDIAMPRRFASINDHQVTVEDPGTLHTVARNLGQVHVWCADLKKLIQRYQFFKVVRCRRWKAS